MKQEELHELAAPYALDALDEDERRQFETHLESCERCRAEVDRFQETAAGLAHAQEGPAPPPALRGRILDAARAERENVVPLHRAGLRRFTLPAAVVAAAAAVAVAVGLGVWAASLADDLDRERSARAATERALALVADPAGTRAPLSGAEGALVVGGDGTAVLVVCELEPAPAGRTYEAWVIREGDPEPAGLFGAESGCTAVELTREVPRGAVVAVTAERAGGAEQPTGDVLFSAEV